MRVVQEKGGFSELLRYFLGALLNSADCKRHFLIGDKDIPCTFWLEFFSSGDEDETVSHENPSSEQGDEGNVGRATSGETRSKTLRFCSQPRLVKLLSKSDGLSPTLCMRRYPLFLAGFRTASCKFIKVIVAQRPIRNNKQALTPFSTVLQVVVICDD